MSDPSLLDRMMSRKIVQWGLAYLAAAWVVFEVTDAVGGRWHLQDVLFQGLFILLVVGFLITLLLAWYHGEKGRQWISGPELLSLALVLSIGGFAISRLETEPTSPSDAGSVDSGTLGPGPLALSLEDPAVAVLPFMTLGDDENQPFADGMHEEVLHALAQVSGLIVKSKQSVLRYRGSQQPLGEIARELGADAVLEGSVRAAGDRVRLTFQLIDSRSDAHLWSRTFDRTLSASQLFAIQEEVAREIARALRVSLTSDDEARLGHRPTQSLDARALYLQAQEAQRTDEAEMRRLLHLAIAMDSTYDRPWGLLAELVAGQALAASDDTLADSAVAMAERAIALDPTMSSGDPYNALGFVYMSRGRLGEAQEVIRTGLRRNPSDPALAANLGILYATAGRFPEAIAAFRRGIEISPTHVVNRTSLAVAYTTLGLSDQAERWMNEARTLQPAHPSVVVNSAWVEAIRGDPGSALEAFEEWAEESGDGLREDQLRFGAGLATWAGDFVQAREYARRAYEADPDVLPLQGGHTSHLMLGFLLALDGDSANAESHLAEAHRSVEPLASGGSEFPELSFELAAIEAVRGRVGGSTRWLEHAHELGFRNYREVDLDPMFDAVRGEPEFERVVSLIRADVEAMRRQVLAMEAEGSGGR